MSRRLLRRSRRIPPTVEQLELDLFLLPAPPPPPPTPRRRSPRGQPSGWIEERLGNTSRRYPTTSYYYCWSERGAEGNPIKQKRYIPIRKLAIIRRMVEVEQCPIEEVLATLHKSTRTISPLSPDRSAPPCP